jgi:protein-S-isoprenylcysteine O-methyltransferase Ste14
MSSRIRAALGSAAFLILAPGVVIRLLPWVAFVRFYEQPALTHRYGEQYREYCREVPAWLPAWRGRRSDQP